MPKSKRWLKVLPQLDHKGPPDYELVAGNGRLWRLHWDGAAGVPWNVQRRIGTAWHHFSAHRTLTDARRALLAAAWSDR